MNGRLASHKHCRHQPLRHFFEVLLTATPFLTQCWSWIPEQPNLAHKWLIDYLRMVQLAQNWKGDIPCFSQSLGIASFQWRVFPHLRYQSINFYLCGAKSHSKASQSSLCNQENHLYWTGTKIILYPVIYPLFKGSVESLNRVTIVAPPQNATVMLGRPTVMECVAQGQPKPLVSWSRQGETQKSFHLILFWRDLWRHSGFNIWLELWPNWGAFKNSVTSHRETTQFVCFHLFLAVLRQRKAKAMTFLTFFPPSVPLTSVWLPWLTSFSVFVQMGSQCPLMWLSSQRTWWLGTQGAIMLACMSAGPTSRRPESLSSRLLSFTFLVWYGSWNAHVFSSLLTLGKEVFF